MTQGVEPGDLDPMTSRHYVTTLKAAYLQLKWFTAAGCVLGGQHRRQFPIEASMYER